MYSESMFVCKLFIELVAAMPGDVSNDYYNDQGWKENMPWLYYMRNAAEVL